MKGSNRCRLLAKEVERLADEVGEQAAVADVPPARTLVAGVVGTWRRAWEHRRRGRRRERALAVREPGAAIDVASLPR
jgi:hypothetical protein